MKIELSEEISTHFARLRQLVEEAEDDEEESFSSRASAMNSMTSMLRDLEKTQASIYNMERLMTIELVVIETLKKYLTEDQYEKFLVELEQVLPDE